MDDLISRQAAIDATWFEPSYTDPLNVLTEVRDRLKALPSADPDLSEYSDKLWKAAYERGKTEARERGRSESMSITIDGVKPPKTCAECFFNIHEPKETPVCGALPGHAGTSYGRKRPDCPIREGVTYEKIEGMIQERIDEIKNMMKDTPKEDVACYVAFCETIMLTELKVALKMEAGEYERT